MRNEEDIWNHCCPVKEKEMYVNKPTTAIDAHRDRDTKHATRNHLARITLMLYFALRLPLKLSPIILLNLSLTFYFYPAAIPTLNVILHLLHLRLFFLPNL